jgi:hypothetical protein
MSDLESAWADAQKRLDQAKEAVRDATRDCKQTMEVIASELWNVKRGDEVMFTPPGRKQWKKAKVHSVATEHGWYDSHEFWQFENRPWLQLHPINKDGTYSKAVIHGYPDCWLTIEEFERQQTAKMEAKQ